MAKVRPSRVVGPPGWFGCHMWQMYIRRLRRLRLTRRYIFFLKASRLSRIRFNLRP